MFLFSRMDVKVVGAHEKLECLIEVSVVALKLKELY